MFMSRRRFLTAAAAGSALVVLGTQQATSPPRRARWFLFGTLVDVELIEPAGHDATPVLALLAERLQRLHVDWHAWKPGRLGDLNRALVGGLSYVAEPSLLALVRDAQSLSQRCGGLFNPAIGGLIGLWGFHRDEMLAGSIPSRDAIERLLEADVTPDALTFNGDTVRSQNPAVQLDLGAYAKGYALDLAQTLLHDHGFADAVVNAGGDLVASGRGPGRPWHIGIRHPSGRGTLALIETAGREAVVTSGNYERYRVLDGRRYAHILDPRTGWPAEAVASATVVCADAALADAASTAISVAGEQWPDVAVAFGIDQAMVVTADGRVQFTRAMYERVDPVNLRARAVSVIA